MKYLIIAFVLLLATVGIGQRPAEAIPVDQFEKVNCEDLLARIDNLLVQLENNPESSAFIVINSKKGAPRGAEDSKTLIETIFQLRRFDLKRLRIVRGKESESDGGMFYLVPPGTDDPIKPAAAWPEKNLDFGSPFIYGVEADDDPCPSFPLPKYAETLRSNPSLRGHIVFFPHPRRNRNALMKEWTKALTVDHKIPRRQLRFFFGKASEWSYTEFWLVPVKENKK